MGTRDSNPQLLQLHTPHSSKFYTVPMKDLLDGELSLGCSVPCDESSNMRMTRLLLSKPPVLLDSEDRGSITQEGIMEYGKEFLVRFMGHLGLISAVGQRLEIAMA